MNSIEVAKFYRQANELSYMMNMLAVGWCEVCKRDWGLRHYAFVSLDVYEAAKCSKILCPECAKAAKK